MDLRAKIVLKKLIDLYIKEGEPISAKRLAKVTKLDLSPATIRSVVADLEEEGYVHSPHTSSGRMPTIKGYRFFVDSLLTIKPLPPDKVSGLASRLYSEEPQKVLSKAAEMLSELSKFMGIVFLPEREKLEMIHLEFLRLASNRVLVILVTQNGAVHNRILRTQREYSLAELREAAEFFNQHYSHACISDVQERIKQEISVLRHDCRNLLTEAVGAAKEVLEDQSDLFISGEVNFLEVKELSDNLENLKTLFHALQKKRLLLELLNRFEKSQDMQIYIGAKTSVVGFPELSVVTAPYLMDGKVVGRVGVIGPTRMAYDRVIPLVDVTAKLIASALGEL